MDNAFVNDKLAINDEGFKNNNGTDSNVQLKKGRDA